MTDKALLELARKEAENLARIEEERYCMPPPRAFVQGVEAAILRVAAEAVAAERERCEIMINAAVDRAIAEERQNVAHFDRLARGGEDNE